MGLLLVISDFKRQIQRSATSLFTVISCLLSIVFTIGQNPKTYEKQKAERFYILFLAVRVYLIVQELSTMIVRKIL